jgi:hypothetical protein
LVRTKLSFLKLLIVFKLILLFFIFYEFSSTIHLFKSIASLYFWIRFIISIQTVIMTLIRIISHWMEKLLTVRFINQLSLNLFIQFQFFILIILILYLSILEWKILILNECFWVWVDSGCECVIVIMWELELLTVMSALLVVVMQFMPFVRRLLGSLRIVYTLSTLLGLKIFFYLIDLSGYWVDFWLEWTFC